MLFVPIWITVVYCPLAFMVWGGGLMSAGGAVSSVFGQVIDFAGGTVVEISSGTAALVLVLILGNRHGFGKDPAHRPHNIPFIMLGAGHPLVRLVRLQRGRRRPRWSRRA